jgi:ATP-dependent Lhr-like helicase
MTPDVGGELEYLGPPYSTETALAALEEPIARWFRDTFGKPTPAQRLAWPALAEGKNLLLCSPTGSGKTLAAFLPIVSRLLAEPATAGIRCLYIAPLKALDNDARKNLRRHLRGLRSYFPLDARKPRVGLRTGDTSARVRRALLLQPPDILLTTPESLAVLLSQSQARNYFANLRWVVVDEVHALASNKRGADLALSLERLTEVTGENLQRIGLSATCAPLAEAARFLVGMNRPCTIAQVGEDAPLQLVIKPLEATGGFMNRLVERLEPELTANRTTLIFTNVRSLAERLAWTLSRRFPAWAEEIAVHHSALAAVRRRLVERRLKQGLLRVAVSSTSLELGIDIGQVDGVVLVHPPGGVVRLLQRVGRAGHEPGRPRRGLVLTASPAELLEASVTGASSQAAQVEPLRVLAHPLDVLCQQLLGMAAQRPWTANEAFALVCRAYPYCHLSRSDFDGCLDYLSGRQRDGGSWLPSRLCWYGDEFSLLDERTARILRQNIGTIITEEVRAVRFQEGPAVGEVDEGFADQLKPGDRFLLDGRCLEFRSTAYQTLLVEEVIGRPMVPRWGGEGWPLSTELARRLYVLRIRAAEALRDGPHVLADLLRRDYGLEGEAITALIAYFQRQECVSEIPDICTCLIEAVPTETGASYYLHTPLNRAGNDALARVAVLRLARDRGRAATSVVADLGFALFLRRGTNLTAEDLRHLLSREAFDVDLTEAIAHSVTFRERFHRVALTGLMILRNPLGRRRRVGGPDWPERRLFDQVRTADPECVLLRQALREIHEECCDAAAARIFLEELPRLTMHCRGLPRVSPFAESWTQLAPGPAEATDGPAEALQRLHAELVLGDESLAG